MPSLYHFNSDQFKENLMLGSQQHMVTGRLCQYLKGWQLDGLRFLYKHFENGEACILNDESGLGKVVTVSVFLGAVLTNDTTKKCLIIVRDEEYIEGWRFHLSVLTSLTVKVIERTSDINYETVFLIKWSTLKNIGEINKVNFDLVIIDNRGEMLTNKFCTGILLRYFENKTTLVISSADVTSNIKLLHILLRLCGRVDKQYTDVQAFEDKFQFPKLKDGVCSKVDLEEYFLKREKLIDYCREFRLRRYCHQFEEEFPLVPCSEFKRHLEQWRTSCENSQSSGSVNLLSSSSEKDTEELFKEYFQVKEERDAHRLDREVQNIIEHMEIEDENVSDEVVVMSPLLFVSDSESDIEQIQVQIAMTEEVNDEKSKNQSEIPETFREEVKSVIRNRRKSTKPSNIRELAQKKSLRSQNVPNSWPMRRDTNKVEADTNVPKKRGRKPKERVITKTGASIRLKEAVHYAKDDKNGTKELENKKANEEKKKLVNPQEDKQRSMIDAKRRAEDKRQSNEGEMVKSNEVKKKSIIGENKTLRKPKEDKIQANKKEKDKRKQNAQVTENKKASGKFEKKCLIRVESEDKKKTAVEKVTENKKAIGKSEKERLIRVVSEDKKNTPVEKKPKEESKKNRRSVRGSEVGLILNEAQKFLNNKNTSKSTKKDIEAKSSRRIRTLDESNGRVSKSPTSYKRGTLSEKKTASPQKSPVIADPSKKSSIDPKVQTDNSKRSRPFTVLTPLGVHSKSTRRMQRSTRSCATQNIYMKVAVAQVGVDKILKAKRRAKHIGSVARGKVQRVAVKQKPPETTAAVVESMQLGQALTPTNITDFAEPAPKNSDYNFPLMLDKDISDSECIRNSQNNEVIVLTSSSENEMEPSKSTVSRRKATIKHPMVTIPRPTFNKAESPDLFSTCSDLSLPCSQNQNNRPHFDGFKIFGSELRQSSKSRSCLDILERMLEPRNSTSVAEKKTTQVKPTCSSPQSHCIDDEDAIFEITSNGTFGNIVQINSNGEVSPIRNKGQSTPPTATTGHPKNRITNYLISNNQHVTSAAPQASSLEDSADLLPKTPKRRKSLSGIVKRSPRALSGGITGGKSQTTKLTQWLVKNSVVRLTMTPPKQVVTKRRRLELSFPDN